MREVRYQYLRPAQLLEEQANCPVVYVPIGPIEWHGPHNAMGLDAMNAEFLALEAARRFGGVVLPTLYIGVEAERTPEMLANIGLDTSEHVVGMDFPANSFKSLYYREETLTLVLRDTIRLLLQNNYRLIVVVNQHGADGQFHALATLQREYDATVKGAKVLLPTLFEVADPSLGGGHATGSETSVLLYQHPECVDLTQLPAEPEVLYCKDWGAVDGVTFMGEGPADHRILDDPRRADAARGQADTEATLAALGALVRAELAKLG